MTGEEDLEDLSGICDCCGTEIRYTFLIEHPNWGAMIVGTHCCDRLTQSRTGSRFIQRRKRFVSSLRWTRSENGSLVIKQGGIRVTIFRVTGGFKMYIGSQLGKLVYKTETEAKVRAFERIEAQTALTINSQQKADIVQDRLSAPHADLTAAR
jgi:hypothetical protein